MMREKVFQANKCLKSTVKLLYLCCFFAFLVEFELFPTLFNLCVFLLNWDRYWFGRF